eukprot:TRINITY_DN1083_c0_g1_i1.p1 TRINITY_DN1083_c0_g1~~TRINITY_DN1083_c0_g1_i1.p1  ORF type:complete len:438 (-),score=49.59 TRINITY_DN1083_c0_g1_i1:25-1338(-)
MMKYSDEEEKSTPTTMGYLDEPSGEPGLTGGGGMKNKLEFDIYSSPFQIEVTVTNPIVNKSHHEYLVKGRDDEGEFEVYRRYKEFISLRNALGGRWPGIYIPPVPPKKVFGNKKEEFVQERMHYLHRYCKKLAHYPFIFFSEETKLFFRSTSDFRSAIKGLPKQVPEDILLKYGNQFKLDINSVDKNNMEDIGPLLDTVKNLPPVINLLKNMLTTSMNCKRIQLQGGTQYAQLTSQLSQYETLNVIEYAEHDESKLILAKPPNDSTVQNLSESTPDLIKPFEDVELWVKEELYEVKAIKEAVSSLQAFIKEKEKVVTKLHSAEATLSKLQQGKSTFKTMFSSKKKESEINNLVVSIPIMEKDIENMTAIANISTCYLRDFFLPEYNKEMLGVFYKLIKDFGRGQIEYSQRMVDGWTDILGDANLQATSLFRFQKSFH